MVLPRALRCLCSVFPGNTTDGRLDFMNGDKQACCSAQRVNNRLQTLKASSLNNDDFPELHGNGIKAANTKALAPYILDVRKRATELNGCIQHKHMWKVVESLHIVMGIFEENSYFLPEAAAQKVEHHLTRLSQHYQMLQVLTMREEKTRWKTTVKGHYIGAHLAEQAKLINPRFVQGYRSESMVGRIGGIYGMSQSGPFHKNVQRVAMHKYRAGMHILWA